MAEPNLKLQRKIVRLHLDGESYRKIAKVTGVTHQAVERHWTSWLLKMYRSKYPDTPQDLYDFAHGKMEVKA